MYVYEMFKNLEKYTIIDVLCNFPNFFELIDIDNKIDVEKKENIKNKIKERLAEAIDDINSKKYVNDNENILITIKRINNNLNYFDTFCLEKNNFSLEEYDGIKNPLFDISFSDRNKILSMTVSEISIEEYGEYIVVASILNEITKFGINENDCIENQEKEKNILEERLANTDLSKAKPIDEAFAELRKKFGFKEPSQEEREKRRKLMEEEINLNMKETKELIIKTYKAHF